MIVGYTRVTFVVRTRLSILRIKEEHSIVRGENFLPVIVDHDIAPK